MSETDWVIEELTPQEAAQLESTAQSSCQDGDDAGPGDYLEGE